MRAIFVLVWRAEDLLRLALRRQLWVWLLVPVVYEVTRREQPRLQALVAGLVGLGVVVLVVNRPYWALRLLVTFLPFTGFLLALVLRFGAPARLVRVAGFWKEAIVAGLVVAAAKHWVHWRPRVDWLDRLAVAYLVLGTAYLLLAGLFVGSAVGAHLSLYARELGWRSDVLYFAVFLACRHLGLTKAEVSALFRRALGVAVALALIGVYEFFAPSSFNHFALDVVRWPVYQQQVLHTAADFTQFVTYSSTHLPRIGSVLNNLTVGWYFILGLGIALEMALRGSRTRWVIASIPLLAACTVLTQSRAAIGGAAVTTVFALRRQIGRSITRRVRMSSFLALVALVALPVTIYAGLAHRFVSSHASNQGHSRGVREGIQVMAHYPMGRGLATGAGGGQTAEAHGLVSSYDVFVPENQWLQIGTQLGVFGLAVYGGAVVLLVRQLRPRDPGDAEGATVAAGVRNGFVGILAGGLFLQPFIDQAISWTTFGLVGLGVGIVDGERRPPVNSGGGLAGEAAARRWSSG